MNDQAPPSGFEFPGVFELAAMGPQDAGLDCCVPDTLEALGLKVLRERLQVRPSSQGKYVSVRVAFVAGSREEYDAAHAALRAIPAVKWTL